MVTTSEKESPARLRCVVKYSPEDIRSHLLYENQIQNPDIPKPRTYPTERLDQCAHARGRKEKCLHAQLRKACASEECPVRGMPCVQAKRMSSRPHPETPKTSKPPKPLNPKTKCPVCGMPCVQATRRSSRPPKTSKPPKPETQNHPNLKRKCPVCGMPCVQAKRMSSRPHPETPKTSKPPKPETQKTPKS